jgi:hypothetical protein
MRHAFTGLVAVGILVVQCQLVRAQENAAPENPVPPEPAASQPSAAAPRTIAPGTPAPTIASPAPVQVAQPYQSMTYVRRGLFGRRLMAVPATTFSTAPTTTYYTTPGTTYYYPRTFRRPFWRMRTFFGPAPGYYSSVSTVPTYTYSSAYQGPGTAPAAVAPSRGTIISQPPAPSTAPAVSTAPAPPPPSAPPQ